MRLQCTLVLAALLLLQLLTPTTAIQFFLKQGEETCLRSGQQTRQRSRHGSASTARIPLSQRMGQHEDSARREMAQPMPGHELAVLPPASWLRRPVLSASLRRRWVAQPIDVDIPSAFTSSGMRMCLSESHTQLTIAAYLLLLCLLHPRRCATV